jgi:hypothetical protein
VSESNRVKKYTLLCLRVAAECRKLAEDVPTPELRAHFLNMAGIDRAVRFPAVPAARKPDGGRDYGGH